MGLRQAAEHVLCIAMKSWGSQVGWSTRTQNRFSGGQSGAWSGDFSSLSCLPPELPNLNRAVST